MKQLFNFFALIIISHTLNAQIVNYTNNSVRDTFTYDKMMFLSNPGFGQLYSPYVYPYGCGEAVSTYGSFIYNKLDGLDNDIFAFQTAGNVNSTTQITANSVDDKNIVSNGGSSFAWLNKDGADYEIIYATLSYNGTTPNFSLDTLTDNSYSETNLDKYYESLVWQCFDGNDNEIYFYDGSAVVQITNNSIDDILPKVFKVSSTQIIWQQFDGNDYEIFMYDKGITTQITNNNFAEQDLSFINSSCVIYSGFDGNDYEIYRYNKINDTDGKTYQLTNNQTDDFYPQYNIGYNLAYNYSIEYFAWVNKNANVLEVQMAISDSIFPISQNIINEKSIRATFSQLFWLGDDGDYEVYSYDIDANVQSYLEVSDTVVHLKSENDKVKIGIKSSGSWGYSSDWIVVQSDLNNLYDSLEISQYNSYYPRTDTLEINLGSYKTVKVAVIYDPEPLNVSNIKDVDDNKIIYNYEQQSIHIQNIDEKMKVDVLDLFGRLLWTGTAQPNECTTVPISGYINGIYIVSLQNQNTKYRKKILKRS